MDYRSVVLECQRYSDTVAFFYVFYAHLNGAGLRVDVEQDRRTPKGAIRTPDFFVVDSEDATDVLEHKASLTDPAHTLEELNSVAQRYSEFDGTAGVVQPQVTLLYPKKQESVVDSIRSSLDSTLNLCSFDQTSSDTEIRLSPSGSVRSHVLDGLLRGSPLKYKPEVRSEYKYIRADPPTPYTALLVWQTFPQFRDIKESDTRTYDVSREFLLRKLKDYYLGWIRDNEQINSARIDHALEFLTKARFIEWRKGTDRIRIDSSKGIRSGDHLETFAKHYAKQHEKRGRRAEAGPRPPQRTMDQYQHLG